MPEIEIQILRAVRVEQVHAFAANERHRLAPVGLQHVRLFDTLDLIEAGSGRKGHDVT